MGRPEMLRFPLALAISLGLSAGALLAEYKAVKPKPLPPGAIEVTGPGSLDRAGKTYVLTRDVSSPTSPIFLGKDVTLDLNGHTITYAAGGYEHVPNYSFEEGLKGWNTANAPGAKVQDMHMIHPMVGRKVCVLPEGQEIISPTINLPVANRAYYAMVAVAGWKMQVDVRVDDADGNPVNCAYTFGSTVRRTCPELNRAPRLGGGVVFALVFGQPAGRYRIRVRAAKGTCVIDAADIRPAMDVGIDIVERTYPWAYYKCVLDGDACAFFDYTKKGSYRDPVRSVPRVTGEGTVTIRNGVIRSGFEGIRSWGIQSTAGGVKVILDNVKFQAAGINTNAVDVPFAEISNCRFEINTPWIINRHEHVVPVVLSGRRKSEVSNCDFIGGQGCLAVRGNGSLIHDNYFENHQTVTNHYSLMCNSEGAKVYRNRFEPRTGSGIYIYRHRNNEVYENTFRISASPPINEYSRTDYSANAIRISDYNASKGSKSGWCEGNRVHHNKFFITGKSFPGSHENYRPMTYAFFISVGGGANYVHDNEIVVHHEDPAGTRGQALAFYVGGSKNGGEFYNNTVTSNVTPVWIGTLYGDASNVKVYDNTFIRAPGAAPFKVFRLGYGRIKATNVLFKGNRFVNCSFSVGGLSPPNQYTRE